MAISKVFATMGASNHVSEARADFDLYTTPPEAVEALLEREEFSKDIWECACGKGDISEVLKKYDHYVFSSDICDHGYSGLNEKLNFLSNECVEWHGDIITNPPYDKALEFVRQSLDSIDDGHKVAMLLKIQFLEGQKRRELFDNDPPYKVYVFSKRINCPKNGTTSNKSSAICFAWFVWIKGNKNKPVVEWI